MPLGPTGYGNSPYMCFSAFAGNPLLISPEKLVEDGFLSPSDARRPPSFPAERVDYPLVITQKHLIFEQAFEQFKANPPAEHRQAFLLFREKHASWLEDLSLFMSLKESYAGQAWTRWEKPLIVRDPKALQECSRRLRDNIDFHQFLQYLFFHQWSVLRQYAHARESELSGTSRFILLMIVQTSGRILIHSIWMINVNRPWWPGCRRTISAQPGSVGATHCTAGRVWQSKGTPGG